MRVHGVDFTSAPARRKPITVATCRLDGDRLTLDRVVGLATLDGFEEALRTPGRWVAGLDLPFTQPRRLVTALGWPGEWGAYADRLGATARAEWRALLEAYKAPRPFGDREHARGYEAGTGAVSPMKLHGVPVALMHHAAVPRIRRSGARVPGLQEGDPARLVLEAYPGVAARALIGRRPYKSDERAKQTPDRLAARRDLLAALVGEGGRARFGLRVEAAPGVAEDPSGDALDALLCAVQAAWASRALEAGALDGLDLAEGWIADPAVVARLPLADPQARPASPS